MYRPREHSKSREIARDFVGHMVDTADTELVEPREIWYKNM